MPNWNNQGCCHPEHSLKPLFQCCVDSSCSDCFTVKPGQVANIKLFEAPPDLCINFQEYVWDKCCCNVTYYDVPCSTISFDCDEDDWDECCCEVPTAEPLLQLGPGTYHACVCDQEGNPVIPDTGDIIMHANIQPGRIGGCCY